MLQTLEQTTTSATWSDQSQILGLYAGMDSSTWRLGLMHSINNPEFERAINKLGEIAQVPNPFFEHAFLKASTRTIGKDKVSYLFLTRQNGSKEILHLFAPVTLEPIGIKRHKVLRAWTTPYSPLGIPLIANTEHDETLKAFIECIKSTTNEFAKAIVFEETPIEGKFITSLYRSKLLSNQLLLSVGKTRAGLKPLKNLDYIETHFSGKRKQKLRKTKADLQALGELSYKSYSKPDDIKEPLEEFLKLEKSGWKGKKKTALSSQERTEQFCREIVYATAKEQKVFIHEVDLNDNAIASLISFQSNGFVYPWKIAFDEAYAKYSVGNLLTTWATSEFANEATFKGLDSLAAENNKTTERFWPDENEFFTVTIGLGENATQTTLAITNELNRLKRIKTTLQKLIKKNRYLEDLVSSLRM